LAWLCSGYRARCAARVRFRYRDLRDLIASRDARETAALDQCISETACTIIQSAP
jgi:hypothetical protein